MQSLVGTLGIVAEDGSLELAKIVRDDLGALDCVSLGGEVSFGAFADLKVLTVLKKGAAVRRLIDAGRIKHGRENYIPAAWIASAMANVTTLEGFFESRIAWIKDDKQHDLHVALLAEIKAIVAAEAQS